MYLLSKSLYFPPVSYADEDGLLAIGGDLSQQRLLLAYHSGIFPWFNDDQPILWFSPDPRMVLFPEELRVSKSMRQVLRKNSFEVSFNTDFKAVIQHCAAINRPEQEGTWITAEMQEAYCKLHELGHAVSVEVRQKDELVGGLYGVWLQDKKIFCGESMFTKVSNASKVGFIKLIDWLKARNVQLIDCQMHTDHLASLGAREIPREDFLNFLK